MPPIRTVRRSPLRIGLTLLALIGLAATTGLAPGDVLRAQTLVGSPFSMDLQNREAQDHAFTFLRNPGDVDVFVRHGLLIRVPGNQDYQVDGASFPYARPEVKGFLEWMGRRYRTACGEPLVATSLVRPKSNQPWNASIHSVHPTGMAMDLRRSFHRSCRTFLESNLLDLEGRGILEATKERFPAHYHVALFPEPFERYLTALGSGGELPAPQVASLAPSGLPEAAEAAAESEPHIAAAQAASAAPAAARTASLHRVRRGETLFRIAQTYGVSLAALRSANGLRGNHVAAGRSLRIPGAAGSTGSTAAASRRPAQIAGRWSHSGTAAARAGTVRVCRGETLWDIARRNGTTVESLRRANGLRGSSVRSGQLLKVPGSAAASPAPRARATTRSRAGSSAHGRSRLRTVRTVRVSRGDTLSEIARRQGISIASLRKANG